jgi:hypothetical protein
MKLFFFMPILFFSLTTLGQKKFAPSEVEKALLTLPRPLNKISVDENIVKAIETVDRHFRQIADTIYAYKSLTHTIFQTIAIETNDSIYLDPLSFGDKIHLTNIVFDNYSLNRKVDSCSNILNRAERRKLYNYLLLQFDNFSMESKKLTAQPVRLKYVKFPDDQFVHIGIDIYGAHFLWTVDRYRNWGIVKVEKLWVY